MGFRSTALSLSVSLSIVGLLTGCASDLSIGEDGEQETFSAASLDLTTLDEPSRLAIRVGQSEVRLGDAIESVFVGEFERPERAVFVRELPPGFNDSFKGQGWESAQKSVAFVAADERVVLGLVTWFEASEEETQKILSGLNESFGLPDDTHRSEHFSYLFWEDGDQILMVCRYDDGKGKTMLTVSLGLRPIMERLRMTAKDARADASLAEERLRERAENSRASADRPGAETSAEPRDTVPQPGSTVSETTGSGSTDDTVLDQAATVETSDGE